MKPEALDAFATKTTRPQALEAAITKMPSTTPDKEAEGLERKDSHTPCEPVDSHKLSTPLAEGTDDAGSAAKMVQEMVNGVKTAIQGAVAWTEKKADELVSKDDSTGPYASPATCAVSDLDPIASGILPAAMPTQDENERALSGQGGDRQDKKVKDEAKRK